MAFLEIDGVHKYFAANHVLRGIDLHVETHKVVCLIGASGSGKSTLLRCINALEDIQAGEIRLDGDVTSGRGVDVDYLRRGVGIVFQSFNLFPHMSVLQNITLGPIHVLGLKRGQAEDRAMALLGQFGLKDKAGSHADRLSGGQQQRVAIARAMAMEPKVLLLDEITSALDPELIGEVLDMVRFLAHSGMTMLLATHEMAFARELADTICFLEQGVILEQGPPELIFESPREERTRSFLRRIIDAGRL